MFLHPNTSCWDAPDVLHHVCKDIGLDVLFKDETCCMTDEWHAHGLVSSLISFILNEHNLSTSTSDPSQVTAVRLYVYFSTYLLLRTWPQSSLSFCDSQQSLLFSSFRTHQRIIWGESCVSVQNGEKRVPDNFVNIIRARRTTRSHNV